MASVRRREALVLYEVEVSDQTYAGWSGIEIGESTLTNCTFSKIRANQGSLGSGMKPTIYTDCKFVGVRFKNVMPGLATFIRCSFLDVKIDTMFSTNAEYIDCVFTGEFSGVVFHSGADENLYGLDRNFNRFTGNDFSRAKLDNVSFRGGLDLADQRLPQGDSYLVINNAAERLSWIRGQVELWPERNLRERADSKLWALEHTCEHGQRDLFLSRAFLGDRSMRKGAELERRLVRLIFDSEKIVSP